MKRTPVTRVGPLAAMIIGSTLLALGCGDGPGDDAEAFVSRWGGDVIAAGPVLQVEDSVAGDAMLSGGTIAFRGHAGGDYLGAAGRQRVVGSVDGSVRAAGGRVELRGPVGRNVTVAGGRVRLAEGSDVRGNAYLAGGTVRVAGGIRRHLRVAGGEVVIDGPVGGDVSVEARQLRIGPDARITGDIRYRVPAEAVAIDPSAQIAGDAIALPAREMPATPRLFRLLLLVGFLVAGVVVVAVFSGTAQAAADALRNRPAAALGLGLVWVVAVPVAAVLAAVTVIGLPLALIVAGLYAVSLYLGRAVTALLVGRLLLRDRVAADRRGAVWSFLLGGVLLLGVGVAPIPALAAAVMTLATLLGLGALALVALAARSA